ncbi:bifunctional hydroxymethylpyrimidine kinase/phosphomethylpyrimidine kinase [Jeotgalibacillus soli]|nr:bifunctional hydroxymethylpyrimidine kinase/phosphomethylpyrimidine kinase [Jeotgalibacillus soli]
MNRFPVALTIAGTDPTGGAGIQADLKTFQELEVYGMSILTSVVAQNTQGVSDIHHLPLSMLAAQLESVFSDIQPHAIKTGMIATAEMMEIVASRIKSKQTQYIMDPVMVATSGHHLIDEQAVASLKESLLPLATVVTPNLPEAEALTGSPVKTVDDMREAAKVIVHDLGAGSVVVKGGHMEGDAFDLFYDGFSFHELITPRINTRHTHGTGCTFSAAIAAELAKGYTLLDAVKTAKQFIQLAIEHTWGLGKGNGPTNHMAHRRVKGAAKND